MTSSNVMVLASGTMVHTLWPMMQMKMMNYSKIGLALHTILIENLGESSFLLYFWEKIYDNFNLLVLVSIFVLVY